MPALIKALIQGWQVLLLPLAWRNQRLWRLVALVLLCHVPAHKRLTCPVSSPAHTPCLGHGAGERLRSRAAKTSASIFSHVSSTRANNFYFNLWTLCLHLAGPIEAETAAYQLMWTAASVSGDYCTSVRHQAQFKGSCLSTLEKLMICDNNQNLLQLQYILLDWWSLLWSRAAHDYNQ